jgi:hypothetical protein
MHRFKMKITITSHGLTITAELPEGATIMEVLEIMKGLLIAHGYPEKLVSNHIITE